MDNSNRAERRKHKYGGGRASEQGGWPTHQPNPVFGAESSADGLTASESLADQDQIADTGPGTGGAMEHAGRAPRHEGAYASNSTKG